jgi:hypothetical protein
LRITTKLCQLSLDNVKSQPGIFTELLWIVRWRTRLHAVNHDHVGGAGGMKTSDTPSNPVDKINETKRIATDIDTSIPDFLKRKKGGQPKSETRDQNAV